MTPSKEKNYFVGIPEFDQVLKKSLDDSKTLDEVGSNLLRLLMLQHDVPMRYWDAYRTRFSWVEGGGSTLQEAANVLGVTRERMRQIQNRLLPLELEMLVAPKVFYKISSLAGQMSDEDSFVESLRDQGLIANASKWNIDSIIELVSIFKVPKFINKFLKELSSLVPIDIDIQTRRTIQSLRNPLGLIDLDVVANQLKVTQNQAADAVAKVYPFTHRQSSLMLASTRMPGMFLSSITKQLRVRDFLTPEDILIGIKRKTQERAGFEVGNDEDIKKLIVYYAGNPCLLANLPSEVRENVTLGNIEEWLKQVFQSAPFQTLHRDELAKLGFEENVNIGSITAFLSNSMIVRPLIPSMFTLVGNDVDKDTAQMLKNRIVANSDNTEINWRVLDVEKMLLSILPNIAGFANGSFMIEKELRALVDKHQFSGSCPCGKLNSKSKIKIVPSKYWTGFSPLLQHFRKEHDWQEGDRIEIELDFFRETATLIF